MAQKYYRFSWLSEGKGFPPWRPHQLRDGDAFVELMPPLSKLRYGYEDVVVNYPASGTSDKSISAFPKMRPTDLLVLTTRPPITDKPLKDHRYVRRSDTILETRILKCLRNHYLQECSRSQVSVPDPFLLSGFGNRHDLGFYVHAYKNKNRIEAAYRPLQWKTADRSSYKPLLGLSERTTAVYLVRTGPFQIALNKSPRLLLCFGLSGTFGLLWAYLLRTCEAAGIRGLLERAVQSPEPYFAMAEITQKSPFPKQITDLKKAASVLKIRLIADGSV